MIVAILSAVVLVIAIRQILLFYNVKFSGLSIYTAFYIFMALCIWMFGEPAFDSFSELSGFINKLDMDRKTIGTTNDDSQGKVIYGEDGNPLMSLTSVPL
jgi:hypothetical protein